MNTNFDELDDDERHKAQMLLWLGAMRCCTRWIASKAIQGVTVTPGSYTLDVEGRDAPVELCERCARAVYWTFRGFAAARRLTREETAKRKGELN